MAQHLRETILDAFVTTLTSATDAGTNVEKNRTYKRGISQLPHVNIMQGNEEQAESGGTNDSQDRALEVHIEMMARDDADVVEDLNQIEQQAHAALMVDRTLGVAAVIDTEWFSTDEPELSSEGEKRFASMRATFTVWYRTNRDDPSI